MGQRQSSSFYGSDEDILLFALCILFFDNHPDENGDEINKNKKLAGKVKGLLMKKEDVIKEIESAFLGVSLGNGIGLWEAQAIDDYESKEVQLKNRRRDEKDNWRLLTYTELQRCHSSLSFFDADGMRFHLPAYIIASLNNKVDDPIFHLTQLDDYAKSKLTTINNTQKQAIITYLKWCLEQCEYEFEHTAISKALSKYWQMSI